MIGRPSIPKRLPIVGFLPAPSKLVAGFHCYRREM
jgi:hypothetical protein